MRTASAGVPFPLTSSTALGENFGLPRTVYVTHIPALLLVIGLVAWIAGNEIGMVIAAMGAAGISLYMLWDWLFAEGATRFSTLLTMTLLMGYGLGALNTWLTLPRGGLSVAQYFGADSAVYARGMAMVLIASAPLCFLGELYERPLFSREFRIPLDQRTFLFIVLGTCGIVAGFLTKSIGYGGQQMSYSGEQLSVLATVAISMFSPLAALSIAIFLGARQRFYKLLIGVCGLVLCTLLMTLGRRNIIYTVMLGLFALRFTGYRLKGTLFRKFFLIAASTVFLAFAVNVFMLIRLAGFQSGRPNTSLVQRIQIAVSWMEDGTALKRATEANQANVEKRTFVLGFFADVLDASTRRMPAMGEDLLGYTSEAIPRVLNPDKDLTFSEERLVDSQFGLTYADSPNSILTNGATDFSVLGVIAYPLLLVWLFRFIVGVLSRILSPFSVVFIALALIYPMLQTENAIEAYLVTIRNVIILSVILAVFSYLPQISMRHRAA